MELLLTDPHGGQTGYNPTNHNSSSTIPNGGYVDAGSLVNDTNANIGPMPPLKGLVVTGPASGIYNLQVFGTGTGPYKLDFVSYDVNGTMSSNSLSGTASPGMKLSYNLNYSPALAPSWRVFIPIAPTTLNPLMFFTARRARP